MDKRFFLRFSTVVECTDDQLEEITSALQHGLTQTCAQICTARGAEIEAKFLVDARAIGAPEFAREPAQKSLFELGQDAYSRRARQ